MIRRNLRRAKTVATVAGETVVDLLRRWRIPIREREFETEELQALTDLSPVAIPGEAREGDRPLQLTAAGSGPLFHRRYWIDIAESKLDKFEIMQQLQADINSFSPRELARFDKVRGEPGKIEVGDEYEIVISGPWNGPVRCIAAAPDSFTFVTLDRHMEAGEITFRVLDHPQRSDLIRFEIVSWARSRDMFVRLAYETLGAARLAQTGMWSYFCHQVVERSGGRLEGNVEVRTIKTKYTEEVIPDE